MLRPFCMGFTSSNVVVRFFDHTDQVESYSDLMVEIELGRREKTIQQNQDVIYH